MCFMCVYAAYPFCEYVANVLLVNHSIFSPCSNLLQLGSEYEHAQSPLMALILNSTFTISNLNDQNLSGVGALCFNLQKQTIKIVLACSFGGRQVVICTHCILYVCAKKKSENIKCFEGK